MRTFATVLDVTVIKEESPREKSFVSWFSFSGVREVGLEAAASKDACKRKLEVVPN